MCVWFFVFFLNSKIWCGKCFPPGACYDTMNNMIWTCSNDYIDQWCNPGNQAFHCVCQRLGVSHVITEPKGELNLQMGILYQVRVKHANVIE